MVVVRNRQEGPDRHVDATSLRVRVLAVAKVSLVHDLGEPHEAAIAELRPLDQGLERAVLPLVAQLDPGRVEGNGVLRELGGRREDEDRVRVDEPLDQPRLRHPVDVGTGPGDPAPPAKLGEIEARP